jgi:CDP-diacylglycerol--serine O-phosphatidyltransferase
LDRYLKIARIVGWAGLASFASLFAAWSAILLLLAGQIKFAVIAACAAFLLDSLDGFLARRLGKASEFGRQLDSMIDVINYSVFAALVTHQILLPNTLGIIAGFMVLAFGVLRLILFNIDGYVTDGDTLYYRGVVTCHLSLATMIVYVVERFGVPLNDWLVFAVLVALSVGQLSTLKTRKTGALLFWIPFTMLTGIGAWFWL